MSLRWSVMLLIIITPYYCLIDEMYGCNYRSLVMSPAITSAALTTVQTIMKQRKKIWPKGDLYLFSYLILNRLVTIYLPANKRVVEIKYCIHTPNTPPVMLRRRSIFVVAKEMANGRMMVMVGSRIWSTVNRSRTLWSQLFLNSSRVSAFRFSLRMMDSTGMMGVKANTG